MAACTPAFHATDSDGDGARAGSGGSSSSSAGRDATTSGSGGTGHAGMSPAGSPGSGGSSGGSGARGGTNGRGGTGARGGMEPGAGGSDESGGKGGTPAQAGATGGSGTQGGLGAQGGSGAQGGTDAIGGRDASGGAGALGAGTSPGGVSASGGRGGLSGSGGLALAGAGGVSGGGAARPCTPALVVDDMEDGDALTCPNQGRAGDWWMATGTPTGAIDPPTQGNFPAHALGVDARPGSTYGMRFAGTSFGHTDDDWASLGFYLAAEAAYDLTPYQGLAFYAKSKSGAFKLNVEFATSTTTPSGDGGACASDCTDHYKGVVTLGGTWQEYSVPFDALAQEGWGVKPKDLAHTLFVYFGFLGTDGGPANFEFLVDDVRLY